MLRAEGIRILILIWFESADKKPQTKNLYFPEYQILLKLIF